MAATDTWEKGLESLIMRHMTGVQNYSFRRFAGDTVFAITNQ